MHAELREVREELCEIREHISSEVRNVMQRYVNLRMMGDRAGRNQIDWGGVARMSTQPSLGEVTLWRLSVDAIIARVDLELRQQNHLQSSCAVYVRRAIYSEKWSVIAGRIHRSDARAKDVVASVTARLYAEFVVRGITEEIGEVAA